MRTVTTTIYEKEDYDAASSMPLREVAEVLEMIKCGHIGDYNFTGDEWDYNNYRMHVALAQAIELVEQKIEEENRDLK